MNRFVHLHVHSHYSLLDALPKIPDLVAFAKKQGLEALALTDSGNLYGAIEFYKECKEVGIKPIIGLDAYVALRGHKDKEPRIDNTRARLVLLVENETGYKNLMKLVTASYIEGFYYKPRIDLELLQKYHEGLIAIIPATNGEKSQEKISEYKKIFGEGNLYREIINPDSERETDLPLVATSNIYYLKPEDKPARDMLLSIQSHLGSQKDNPGFGNDEEDLSFATPKEMAARFRKLPEALENSAEIAYRCNLELKLGTWVFPNYVVPEGKTHDSELRDLVYAGFERRKLQQTPENFARVEYELNIITGKGYSPYFLVAADLLRYAHDHGILTNTRGSAAGSMVTYLAGITTINPLEYALPFERFLNPDRPSAPDIDLDIADNRRDELIEYAKQKYGTDHVAQIGTFGTMMARGAVRDVARALGLPYSVGDLAAKLIPMGAQGFPMTIERAMKENSNFKKLYETDADTKTVVDMAREIEGNARHISVHAAGVVIAPGNLTDYTPLQMDTKGENKIITQYDMYSIEEAGLLKFDFLGIRNLSIMADAIERIKKIEGKDIDISTIPINDKKTFEMLARGETEGTFQLNGDGMTRSLIDLKPTRVEDINVMVALYRPGPMDNIKEYIARKHGKKPVTYLHPKMKNFLDKTYGVLVYQDDLLMTAIEVAGYSWGEVDKFRKAVGKKIPAEMKKQHIIFVEGCQKHGGMSAQKAEELWELFEPFQGYGFNKAHAASYGLMAYQTAYLKAHFPAIYMSAILTAESGDIETIGIMVNECKRMGINVLPPSVNESYSQFTVVNDPPNPYKIRFGLVTIKNFGQGIATAIIEERKRGGKFTSLIDFLDRVKDKNLNKRSLEALIKVGAMDDLPASPGAGFGERGILMANIDNLLAYNRERASAPDNQDSLFGQMTDTSTIPALRLAPAPEATQKEKLKWEKELLGLYISGHPLDTFKIKLENHETSIKKLDEMKADEPCVIAGLITNIREVTTKKGERMTFIGLEDLTGETDVVVFPKVFEEFKQFIIPENCIAIKGKVSKRNGETSFIADKIKSL